MPGTLSEIVAAIFLQFLVTPRTVPVQQLMVLIVSSDELSQQPHAEIASESIPWQTFFFEEIVLCIPASFPFTALFFLKHSFREIFFFPENSSVVPYSIPPRFFFVSTEIPSEMSPGSYQRLYKMFFWELLKRFLHKSFQGFLRKSSREPSEIQLETSSRIPPVPFLQVLQRFPYTFTRDAFTNFSRNPYRTFSSKFFLGIIYREPPEDSYVFFLGIEEVF